jgi:hypothetical protein
MQKLTRLTRLARLCGILFMTGCAVPVTDGYYAQLPVVGARIMVTGNHISSISTAIAWLENAGSPPSIRRHWRRPWTTPPCGGHGC